MSAEERERLKGVARSAVAVVLAEREAAKIEIRVGDWVRGVSRATGEVFIRGWVTEIDGRVPSHPYQVEGPYREPGWPKLGCVEPNPDPPDDAEREWMERWLVDRAIENLSR